MFFYGSPTSKNIYCYQFGQVLLDNKNKKSKEEQDFECNASKITGSVNITEKSVIMRIVLYIMGFCYNAYSLQN